MLIDRQTANVYIEKLNTSLSLFHTGFKDRGYPRVPPRIPITIASYLKYEPGGEFKYLEM